MERAIKDVTESLYKVNKSVTSFQGDGNIVPSYLRTKLTCIRYANDLIVLGKSRRMIEKAVKPAVISFLKERGLSLSPENTKIISVRSSEHIDFLGYTFQYFPMFKPKYKLFHDRIGKEGIACYPQKKEYGALIVKLRLMIRKAYNKTAYEIIRELNPIIRDWCQYYNLSQSYQIRNILSNRLFILLTKWAMRKHPRWGKSRIAKNYFINARPEKKDSEQGGKPRKWVFHGHILTRNPTRYYNSLPKPPFVEGLKEEKRIDLFNPTREVPTISAIEFRIPPKLEQVHAFHPQYEKLIEFNSHLRRLTRGESKKILLVIKPQQVSLTYS